LQTRIVEFQFAVYLVSLPLKGDFREDQVPAPEYCEKEEFEKEVKD
jgi:hypothetical protein